MNYSYHMMTAIACGLFFCQSTMCSGRAAMYMLMPEHVPALSVRPLPAQPAPAGGVTPDELKSYLKNNPTFNSYLKNAPIHKLARLANAAAHAEPKHLVSDHAPLTDTPAMLARIAAIQAAVRKELSKRSKLSNHNERCSEAEDETVQQARKTVMLMNAALENAVKERQTKQA